MKLTRISLYYLATYLPLAGLALLFVPDIATKLLLSNRTVAELDDENPVALSRAAVLGTLRRELRFDGLALTTNELDIFLGKNYVVTHHDDPIASIDEATAVIRLTS